MIPWTYSLRSLLRRPVTVAATTVGLTLVVFVFAAVLMLSHGVEETLAKNGSPDNALILRDGASSEMVSGVSRDQARVLSALSEAAVDPEGRPLVAAELAVLAVFSIVGGESGKDAANLGLRGMTPASLRVRPTIKVVQGRLPNFGTSEIMVGTAIEGRYVGARVGQSMQFARRQWSVVGVFEADGAAFESEIWGDALQLMDAFNRQGYSSVVMRLKDANALALLNSKIAADPQLSTLKAYREDKFFDAQSESLRRFITALGTFVAVIFAIAAALGASVTMYAQVAGRVREIGTLRALGFRRGPILWVFLRESLVLAGLGGALGVLAASALSHVGFAAMNQQSFTVVTFHFTFAPAVGIAAFAFSLCMGLLGGFLPAVSAARLPIVSAVRGGR